MRADLTGNKQVLSPARKWNGNLKSIVVGKMMDAIILHDREVIVRHHLEGVQHLI